MKGAGLLLLLLLAAVAAKKKQGPITNVDHWDEAQGKWVDKDGVPIEPQPTIPGPKGT